MTNAQRIKTIAQQLRATAEGASGPEMHVPVSSAALLELLDAFDARAEVPRQVQRAGEIQHFLGGAR